ncbi:MAG: general secretion pathway protein GspB [Gammaproteobacteria bacterium]|nr:general secretion pathway protein GspB [Gammaproteobacteria bacterium]MCY4166011.1 general secretion pathway protein GspB [Gammaproteobacteria bacterium]MCY4341203.1 general secretion pathway protein GspB [Gammaproteobacteria bacterium]
MSFVLDALKVSERRRSRFSRRVYAHPPRPRRGGRRRNWLIVLGVPGALALVVAGWNLAAPGRGPLSQPTPADSGGPPPSSAASADTSAAAARPPAALKGSDSLNAPAPVADANKSADAEPGPAGAAEIGVFAEPGSAGAPNGMELRHERSAPAMAASSAMPDISSAAQHPASPPVSTREALTAAPPGWPALSLQMLFFSEDESRSFVQVNGKTYRQGEQLAAGPQVLTITKDAVTLAYRGQVLLLGAER